MGKTIDMMGAIELDALGAAHDTPRHFSGGQVEPDSYYRERLRVVLAANNPLQMPAMNLRDYFAAKAMQAVLCDSAAKQSISVYAGSTGRTFGQEVAIQAYDMAECMLAERDK